ncbi:MAG: T9SS type A sorting domain-containing protein [Candidatus Nomurabacteria bacterium]|nr:T9SS type A sorting domain-containing protein [Candidatus Nomurabacteria bacterium]
MKKIVTSVMLVIGLLANVGKTESQNVNIDTVVNTVGTTTVYVVGTWSNLIPADSSEVTYSAYNWSAHTSVSTPPSTIMYYGANAISGTTTYQISGLAPHNLVRAKIHIDSYDSTGLVMRDDTINFWTDCLPVPVSVTGNQTVCAGDSITLTASGASTYNWMPGNLSGTIVRIPLSATTTFTVTGTSESGCTGTATKTVTVNALPNVTASMDAAICAGNSVSLGSNGATTYSWLPATGLDHANVQHPVASPVTTTTYTVTGTTSGCSNTATTTVTVTSVPTVAVSGTVTNCPGSSNQLSASGATSYVWLPAGTLSDPNIANPVATPATTTTYTVIGSNGICSATAQTVTVTITSNPPITITPSPSAIICNGSSVTLTMTGVSIYELDGVPFNGNSTVVSPSATTTYTVTGSTSGCTGTSTATIQIVVNPVPTVTVSNDTSICSGSSITLHASGATTYSWMPGNHSGQSWSVTPSVGTTTYTVTGTTSGCSNTATVNVTVNQTPILSVDLPTTICFGTSITLSANGANSYNWMPGNLSSSSVTVSPNVTTTYTVTGSNGNCSGTPQTVEVTVIQTPTPIITTASGTDSITICLGQTTTLTANQANVTYEWSPGGSFWNSNIFSVSPSGTTTYTVVETAGTIEHHCSVSTTAVVTVVSPPVVTASASNASICNGSSTTLTVSGATTYSWNSGANIGPTWTVMPVTGTTYTVTGSNGNCSATSTVTVTVTPTPPISVSATATSICVGDSVTFVATGSGSTTYSWMPGNLSGAVVGARPSVTTTYTVTGTTLGCTANSTYVFTITVNGVSSVVINPQGPTTFCQGGSVLLMSSSSSGYITWSNGPYHTNGITVNSSGTYTVQLSVGGCSVTSPPVTVTVNQLPAPPTISTSGSTTFCDGDNVILTASVGFVSYLWTDGTNAQSTVVTTTGNYNVTGTDLNGCSSTGTSVPVLVKPLPTANIFAGGPTTLCFGNSVQLTATGGASYLWNNSVTTQTNIVSASGSYFVTVTGANGCSKTSTPTVVTVNPLPNASITYGGNLAVCDGNSVLLTAHPTTGNYSWSDGTIGQTTNANTAGIYSVIVTNSFGCSATANSLPIVIHPNPTVIVNGAGSVLVATAIGGSAPYNYIWNPGGAGQSMTFTTATSYTVTATDANGCSGSLSSMLSIGIEEVGEELINMYPNPFSNVLTVEIKNGNYKVSVSDITGRTVRDFKADGTFQIDKDNLTPGIYFIHIQNDKRGSYTRKVSVN